MNEHAAKTIETRIAYYYLKDNGKIKSYYDYEKGKITREQLLEKIPKEELKTVINIEELRNHFTNCSEEEITDIISLCMKMYSSKKIEHAELVLTAPDSFRVKALRTKDTMRNMIENTEKSLTITGYSISDYFAEMLDVIIKKSQQEICAVQTAKETNDIINIGEQENNVQVYKLITTCLSAHNEDTEMSFYLPSGIARKITGITYGDGYEYINENNEVIYKFSDVDKDWKNQQVCLQVNTSILESALKENSYKLFWVFRVYRSPSNKAYELYGNQICHDTDRSFVVWFDEEECKYIELKEIKPIRPNTYDDYELNIKILYGDAED